MDDERRRWLEGLAQAAGHQADRLRAIDGHYHAGLIQHLERLRSTLEAELGADSTKQEPETREAER